MQKKFKILSSIVVSFSLFTNTVFAGTYTITTKDQLFTALSQDIKNFDETANFTFKGINATTINSWLKEAGMKLGNYANITKGFEGSYTSSGSDILYTLKYKYNLTKEEYNYVVNYVKQVLSEIITEDMDIFEKEKAIHNWIIQNVDYDYSYKIYDAYRALNEGKTVCNGYAMLADIMFNEAGIPSVVVIGNANNGTKTEAHAWNLVNLNGNWYHVDLTWDDLQNGKIRYDYFNLRTEEIKKDHFPTSIFPTTSTKSFEQLLKEVYGEDTSKYIDFYTDQILDRVDSLDELAIYIKNALDGDKTSLKFAYKSNFSSSINTLRNYVPQLGSFSYSSRILPRLNGTGYTAVTIENLTKRDVNPTNILALKFLKTSVDVRKGQQYDLKQILNVYPFGLNNVNLTWTSSNAKVATVENGVVNAQEIGSTTIKVVDTTNSRIYAQITVKVPVNVESLAVKTPEIYMNIGTVLMPQVVINPTNATYKTFTMTSSDSNVVEVLSNKLIAKA